MVIHIYQSNLGTVHDENSNKRMHIYSKLIVLSYRDINDLIKKERYCTFFRADVKAMFIHSDVAM